MSTRTSRRRAAAAAAVCVAMLVGSALASAPASAATCPTVSLSGAVSPAASPGVDWSGCNLQNANLLGVSLAGANLSAATLQGAHLINANLTGADLTGATLTGTYLSGATLTNATVTNADVAGSILGRSTTARLTSGGLVGTPQSAWPLPWEVLNGYLVGPGSNLADANLSDNDLSGVDVSDSDLTRADLSLDINIDSILYDSSTIWTDATCPLGEKAYQRVGGTCAVDDALDATAPVVRMTAPTAVFTAATLVPFAWVTTEAGSGFWQAHYRVARAVAIGGSLSAWSTSAWSATWPMPKGVVKVVPGYRYCVEVQAEDKAHNIGAWSAPGCTTTPLDDRAFAASKGWVRAKGSAWYASTYSSTTLAGKALVTTRSATVRRLSLVATQCATCGSVSIYVGSTRVAVVSLRTAKLHNRALIVLPLLKAARAGKVKVLVTSKGKLVRIDAVGISSA